MFGYALRIMMLGSPEKEKKKKLRNREVDNLKKMKAFKTPGRVLLLETGKRTFQEGARKHQR